jgi:hypothetical protein
MGCVHIFLIFLKNQDYQALLVIVAVELAIDICFIDGTVHLRKIGFLL